MQPDPVPGHPTPGMHIWGWMSPEELEWLHATAAEMNSIVEIGCLHGRSAYALATGTAGNVYCIDPWNDDGYRSFMSTVGQLPNVVPIREASPAASRHVPYVDMTFIDGDHSYDSVLADIEEWLPKTRKLICGHDYIHGGGFPDVAVAVDEVFGRDRVVVPEGLSIWTVTLS